MLHSPQATREHQQRIALVDDLTGLANRPAILLAAGRALDQSNRHGRTIAILAVGLDGFTHLDESLGRETSNEILKLVGERLCKASRGTDIVARIETDRFAVLIDMLHNDEESILVTGRIEAALREPIVVNDESIHISATIGIACGQETSPAGDLLDNALIAMSRAKRDGGGRWEMYNGSQRTDSLSRLRTEADLVKAIAQGGIGAWFQPIVDVPSGDVVAIEALVRWHHPDLGVLSPGSFLGIAEDAGLLPGLWRAVVEEALSTVAMLRKRYAHLQNLGVVLNLSPTQISHPGLVDGLLAKLAEHGLAPQVCTLDVQVTTIAQLERNRVVLSDMRARGLRIALDDVGSGALPLAELREFPVDTLKIDSALTSSMSTGSAEAGLILGLVHVARALGSTLIAEGVERLGVLRQLEAAGVSQVQGHLLCPALPVDELMALMTQPKPFHSRLQSEHEPDLVPNNWADPRSWDEVGR
jgi:diguanylate cyclase (GGDEF)-like protein